MTVGGLHTNRPQYGMVHHPYDPTVVDEDGFPILRDIPAVGRLVFAQQPGSVGVYEICFDIEPFPDRYGGGTWRQVQPTAFVSPFTALYQGDPLDHQLLVGGAHLEIRSISATHEAGAAEFNWTVEVQGDGTPGERVYIDVGSDDQGFEWEPADPNDDVQVGTWSIGTMGGWVRAQAGLDPPIRLEFITAGGDYLGEFVTLGNTDIIYIEGRLPYIRTPQEPM